MSRRIFFKTAEHQQRFLRAMQQIGKINAGKLDPEYAAALYILTADAGTWRKASEYVSRHGIDVKTMLDKVDFSSGYIVLIRLAGNLFNNQQHLDPLEFLRLDERNFHLALTALILRRSSFLVDDFDVLAANETVGERKTAERPFELYGNQHIFARQAKPDER
jgi:hypothetical protein